MSPRVSSRALATILLPLLILAGCSGESDEVAERLDEKSARDVMEAASEDSYTPPADGRLSRSQVEMYLEVRRREQEIARVARQRVEEGAEKIKNNDSSLSGIVEGIKSFGSAADFFTADIRAAQELGYNTAEYEWVKEQVLEAAGSVMKDQLAAASRGVADRHAEDLRRKMAESTNETEKNTYARILETYESSVSSSTGEKNDPSVVHNRELLAEYEDALDTLGFELAKFEIREGQAAEQVEKLHEELKTAAETTEPQR